MGGYLPSEQHLFKSIRGEITLPDLNGVAVSPYTITEDVTLKYGIVSSITSFTAGSVEDPLDDDEWGDNPDEAGRSLVFGEGSNSWKK
jgi:hypothetical protein